MEHMFLEMLVKVLAFILIPDNATGHVMLTKIINFHGVIVDLYDVMEKDAKPANLRPISSLLSGRSAESQPA